VKAEFDTTALFHDNNWSALVSMTILSISTIHISRTASIPNNWKTFSYTCIDDLTKYNRACISGNKLEIGS